MGRWATIGVLGGLVLASQPSAGCNINDVFHCSTNEQCVVEHGGRCESVGYCSFPDAACPSGRRFGEQASQALAGRCVDESPDESAGEGGSGWGSGVADSADSADDGSGGGNGTGGNDSADDDSAVDGSADDGVTSVGSTSAATSGTGEPVPVCTQEDSEPNDGDSTAEVITGACVFERTGSIGDGDTVDWYSLQIDPDCLLATNQITVTTTAAIDLCVRFSCADGGIPNASCSGSVSVNSGGATCCSQPMLSATLGCSTGDAPLYFLTIESDEPACHEYDLAFGPG